ncbi:MAG: acyl-CoA dehydratase activase-related protein, partial [Nannocystaceae bacterium]
MALGQLLQIRKKEDKPEETIGTKRLIIATCEKGEVEDIESMRKIKSGLDRFKQEFPNLAAKAAKDIWRAQKPPVVADKTEDVGLELVPENLELPPNLVEHEGKVGGFLKRINRSEKVASLLGKAAQVADKLPGKLPVSAIVSQRAQAALEVRTRRIEMIERREKLRIGIPRVLNQYSQNPFFSAYFEALGVPARNIVYSDFTSEELYKEGAKRGAIDPCFPSKVCIAHMHNLLEVKHKRRALDLIVFPQVDSMESWLTGSVGHRACPTVVGSADTTKAAFTKEEDIFAKKGTKLLVPFVQMAERKLCEHQMFTYFKEDLGLSEEENRRAVDEGFKAQDWFFENHRNDGRAIIEELEREQRIGVVLLARPYHNDPGMCHEIPDELQKLGYPVLTVQSLPLDRDIVDP